MKSSPLSEVVGVESEVDAVEDRVAAGSELQFAIALSGVLVDGKVPLLELAAVAQSAERRSTADSPADGSNYPSVEGWGEAGEGTTGAGSTGVGVGGAT